MKLLFYIIISLFVLGLNVLWGQNLSSEQLIRIWNIDDVNQTIEAELTYDDLVYNFDVQKFDSNVANIQKYLDKHPKNLRLKVRLEVYQVLGQIKKGVFTYKEQQNELKEIIKLALSLHDEQLLSEIYTLYSENKFSPIEDKFFYELKAIEIQERIGVQYFPRIFQRYYAASNGYYHIDDYNKSIRYGLKCLKNIESSKINLHIYLLQLDLLGASYYEIGKKDSGLYYYLKLQDNLVEYVNSYNYYRGEYEQFDSSVVELWKAISNGGIARGLILDGDYEQAISLLKENMRVSKNYNELGDWSKAKNYLAEVYFKTGKYKEAIQEWNEALSVSDTIEPTKLTINMFKSLSDTYAKLNQYENAYKYNNLYHNLKEKRLKLFHQNHVYSIYARLELEKTKDSIRKTELIAQKQDFIKKTMFIGSILILILAGIVYGRYRLKQKLKLQLYENEREIAELKADQSQKLMLEAKAELEEFKQKLNELTKTIESLWKKNDANETNPVYMSDQLTKVSILTEKDWNTFRYLFNTLYPTFIKTVIDKYPEISQAELRYLCMVKLGLNHREIGSILAISPASLRVTWHRIKQKINLNKDISSSDFVNSLEDDKK